MRNVGNPYKMSVMATGRTQLRRLLALLSAVVVVPVAGQFFVSWADEMQWYAHPSERVAAVIAGLNQINSNFWFHWIGGAMLGLAGGVWLDAVLKRRDDRHPRLEPAYVETFIKFERSKSTPTNFECSGGQLANIYRWQQVYDRREETYLGPEADKVVTRVTHNDYFFFIFEKETDYNWPIINSFGHEFPAQNFYATTKRGAILQVTGGVKVPMFEVRFPPVEKSR